MSLPDEAKRRAVAALESYGTSVPDGHSLEALASTIVSAVLDGRDGYTLIDVPAREKGMGALTVTVMDYDKGDWETLDLEDYVIVTKPPYHVHHRQFYANGTTVITVKRDDG